MGIRDDVQKMEKGTGKMWSPTEIGECFGGVAVTGLQYAETKKYGKRPFIKIKSEEDGEIYTIWCGVVIENELIRQQVESDDQVGLKYLGPEKNYTDYIVLVKKMTPIGKLPSKHESVEQLSVDSAPDGPDVEVEEDIPY